MAKLRCHDSTVCMVCGMCERHCLRHNNMRPALSTRSDAFVSPPDAHAGDSERVKVRCAHVTETTRG